MIGDFGMQAIAWAVARGALPQCTEIAMDGNDAAECGPSVLAVRRALAARTLCDAKLWGFLILSYLWSALMLLPRCHWWPVEYVLLLRPWRIGGGEVDIAKIRRKRDAVRSCSHLSLLLAAAEVALLITLLIVHTSGHDSGELWPNGNDTNATLVSNESAVVSNRTSR